MTKIQVGLFAIDGMAGIRDNLHFRVFKIRVVFNDISPFDPVTLSPEDQYWCSAIAEPGPRVWKLIKALNGFDHPIITGSNVYRTD